MGGSMGVTQGMVEKFGPERVRNTPISESAIVGTGRRGDAGHAPGRRDHVPSTFSSSRWSRSSTRRRSCATCAAARPRCRSSSGRRSGTGRGSAAQHAQSLESWFMHIPGLKVVVPRRPTTLSGLLKTAIRDDNPVIFLEHRLLYLESKLRMEVPADDYAIPFGQADVQREGKHVTVVGIHTMVHRALKAARDARRGGHRAGGDRPAHRLAARRRDDRHIGAEDEPADHLPRGVRAWRHGRRGGDGGDGRGLRLPGRADRARGREVSHRSRSRRAWSSGSSRTPRTCSKR